MSIIFAETKDSDKINTNETIKTIFMLEFFEEDANSNLFSIIDCRFFGI